VATQRTHRPLSLILSRGERKLFFLLLPAGKNFSSISLSLRERAGVRG